MTHTPRTTRTVFDPAALLAALDTRRRAEGISWRELARRAGIPGTYGIAGKLRSGAQPGAGTLALLLRYLGHTDLAPYLREQEQAAEPVAPAA